MEKQFVLLVINPKSGGRSKEEDIQFIRNYVKNEGYRIIVYQTRGEDDENQVRTLTDKYTPCRILIAGGDGTIRMVAEALTDKQLGQTVLGVLPLGSANGLAEDLNLPDDLPTCLEIALKNQFMHMDSVSINGMKSLHLSDIGLNAELIKNYKKHDVRGKLGYALQVIPTLRESKESFKAHIQTETEEVETEAQVILIANSQKYGTGVVVNPLGIINDDIFEIVVFKHLELMLIIKILLGNLPLEDDAIRILQTKKATIKTNTPISFQIDGEYCEEVTRLQIEMNPQKIRIAVP